MPRTRNCLLAKIIIIRDGEAIVPEYVCLYFSMRTGSSYKLLKRKDVMLVAKNIKDGHIENRIE